MENKTLAKEISFLLVTTIIGVVLSYVLDRIVANIYVSIFSGVLLISTVFVIYGIRKAKVLSNILGITNIYTNHDKAPKIYEIIKSAQTSIDFVGISLRTVFETEGVERLLIEKAEASIKLRFLILNPDSPYVEKKAKDEGDAPEVWKHDIQSSLSRLKEIQGRVRSGVRIEIALYDSMPNWRCVFVDDKIVFASFYPHGKRGKAAPVLVITKTSNSLYVPFHTDFTALWITGEFI